MSLDVAQIIKADHDNIRDLFMRLVTVAFDGSLAHPEQVQDGRRH